MGSLYDVLGVTPDATPDELRRAYRQRVRDFHPDSNPRAGEDAIRELNAAWAVLGNADRRRDYDRTLGGPALDAPRPTYQPPVYEPEPPPGPNPFAWIFRPSALIVAVLLTIMVVTAYAGSHSTNGSSTSTSTSAVTPTTTDASQVGWLINQCMLTSPGHEAVVTCQDPNAKQVMAVLPNGSSCPAATLPYQLTGRDQEVCLASHR